METTSSASPANQFTYPAAMNVFGIVVDDRLASALIKLGLAALNRVNVDLVVFLCIPPHDIRDRTDWDDILDHIRIGNDKEKAYEVRLLQSPEELLDASLKMRVIRLPDDSVVMRI